MQQYRTGVVAPKGRPVRAGTPEEAIQFLRQTLEVVADYNPGFNTNMRTIDRRLSNLSARSLHVSGAMAMLCGGVDNDTTGLFGRWRSEKLLTYLRTQAKPLYGDFSARMRHGGDYPS